MVTVYVMAVIKKSDFLYLFDSHAWNLLGIPDKNGTAVVLKFSELDEFQNHVETLGHCLNVRIFEIASVYMHANVCAAQLSEQSHVNGVETITELSVSGKKRDEQKQATLTKRREAYQKKKACETEAQRHAKRALKKERIMKREKHQALMSKDKLDMLRHVTM